MSFKKRCLYKNACIPSGDYVIMLIMLAIHLYVLKNRKNT